MSLVTETRFDILRHGEPDGEDCFRGSGVDHPLTEQGWQQMRAALKLSCQSKDPVASWDLIVSSPLSRCHAFASELSAQLGLELIVDDSFKEIGFGVWEGKTKQQVMTDDAQAYQRFRDDPVSNRPVGAEPLEKFTNRVWHQLEKLSRSHPGKRILVVSHAGVLRVITAKTLGLPLNDVYNQLKIEYAATLSCLFNDKGRARLLLPTPL